MSELIDWTTLRTQYFALIDRADVSEEEIHQFLVRYPVFLPLWFPYQNTIFSKMPLGNQHITDFSFARMDSPGVTWHFVEIEKPQDPLFTQSGDPTTKLTHAIRQLHDWETWFINNRDYVQRHFPHRELMRQIGLYKSSLHLVMGRRGSLAEEQRQLIQRLETPGIEIMTFDRLATRLSSPAYDVEQPLRSCRFIGRQIQKIETAFEISMQISFTIT